MKKGSFHRPESKAKTSKTMFGRKLTDKHKQSIKINHSSNKESGAFYWSAEYKAKQSKPKKGCREAAYRQHYGRRYEEYVKEHAPEQYNKPIEIVPAIDRPDWLKDYI